MNYTYAFGFVEARRTARPIGVQANAAGLEAAFAEATAGHASNPSPQPGVTVLRLVRLAKGQSHVTMATLSIMAVIIIVAV